MAGRGKADRALRVALNIAVAADLLLVLYILIETKGQPLFFSFIVLTTLCGVGVSALYVKIISKKMGTSTQLTEMLPWSYLGLSYVLYYMLPPLLFLTLAWHEPLIWVLVVLSALSLLGVSINFFFYNPKK
jgi:hypothetical protein